MILGHKRFKFTADCYFYPREHDQDHMYELFIIMN